MKKNSVLRSLVLQAFNGSGWGFSRAWVHYKAIVKVVNGVLRDSGPGLVRASVIEREVRRLAEKGWLVGNGKGFFQLVGNRAHYFARSVNGMPDYREVYGGDLLTAKDLEKGKVNTVIQGVALEKVGDSEKVVLTLKGLQKKLALNKTNAKRLAEISGSNDFLQWKGAEIQLYKVVTTFHGEEVEAVRLRSPLEMEKKEA